MERWRDGDDNEIDMMENIEKEVGWTNIQTHVKIIYTQLKRSNKDIYWHILFQVPRFQIPYSVYISILVLKL